MKALSILLTILCFQSAAWPCANLHSSGTKLSGESTSLKTRADRELLSALRRDLKTEGETLEAKLRSSTTFEDRSDYAVALMYLGRSPEAVKLLNALELERPGDYSIAANLGTALELSGDNAGALHWIREGIHRNPKSHSGTEWLHVKILESKLAQERDPSHFSTHSVLELNPDALGKIVKIDGTDFSLESLREALRYQLKERVQFVKPPDAVVATLLLDYAAVEAAARTLESAETLLRMATQYGLPQSRVQSLLDRYGHQITVRKIREYTITLAIGLFFCGLVFAVLKELHKSGHFVISSKSNPTTR